MDLETLAKNHYSATESEEYKQFVEKFKPKKTTDDCYTPPEVYEAVKQWVLSEREREIIKRLSNGAEDD